MTQTLEIFCAYCRLFKPDDGLFKAIRHEASRTQRMQCGGCQAVRRKPPKELQKLAELDAAERRLGHAARGRLSQQAKKEALK